MPTPSPIQFGKTMAQARTGIVSIESVVNLYLERNPETSKGPVTLYGTPGLKPWLDVGDGPIRGIQRMGPDLYVVSGGKLYRVNSLKAITEIGDVEGTGNVHMTTNGTHVAVGVVGGKLYAANASGIVELTTVSNICGATYQDGYGIFGQSQTENFWITAVDDMTTISALDFSTADAWPDKCMGIISDHRELVIFGEETTEVWFNSGNAAFPFERAGGGYIEHGCRAPGSIAKAENTVLWLGDDLTVYSMQGYQPQALSPPWVERLIAGTVDPGGAWGFTYRQDGHVFYVLGFSDLTLCYDLTSGQWHQRKSDGLDRWRANCHAKLGDIHLVGDYERGELFELDLDTYDDDGDTIRREVTAPPLFSAGQRAVCHEMLIDMETGVGLVAGQGSDPQVMLDWSDDGGASWSNIMTADAGAIGERMVRATFNRLGAFRQRTFRVAISDPVKVAIVGAYVRAEGLGG